MSENPVRSADSIRYWARTGYRVRNSFRAHQISGQLDKTPGSGKREWGNVTEHCLVQVPRAEILGEWIGIPTAVIEDIKQGVMLHDAFKKEEITQMRAAEEAGESPLAASRTQAIQGERILQEMNFSRFIIRLAHASGGQASELIETQRILNKPDLDAEDWAYLIVHYTDDCSIGSNWVRPMQTDQTGGQTNIIDFRTAENKTKPGYRRVAQEITSELEGHPIFNRMDPHDAMALVSHQIEERLARAILERTGEVVNPLEIPELVDKKIQQDIANI